MISEHNDWLYNEIWHIVDIKIATSTYQNGIIMANIMDDSSN